MRTVWLASYPKSGNTWMRMLLANLATPDGPVDINSVAERDGISSARETFDRVLLFDAGLLTDEEADRLRPLVYVELAKGRDAVDECAPCPDRQPVRYVKAHDAYSILPDGAPLLAGSRGADGAILIVRDPRDVASSLANHLAISVDDAITFMNDPDAALSRSASGQALQLRQRLGTWSTHVTSWLDQRDLPVCVVRYEDLLENTPGMVRLVLGFTDHAASDEQVTRAIEHAEFSKLKTQEREKGFREAPRRIGDGGFFRRGRAGAWRDELAEAQVARVETAHGAVMRRLGYDLMCANGSARAPIAAR